MIEPGHARLSIVRQCELVSISRSAFYYEPTGETPLNLVLMRLIDAQFLETPFYGARQMARHLRRQGYAVGRKRVRRLMARMGLSPIYQKPKTSEPHPAHRIAAIEAHSLSVAFAAAPGNSSSKPKLAIEFADSSLAKEARRVIIRQTLQ
jgi:putative transposase